MITIIGILMSLLLPAVQEAREAARLATCKNNLHQVGVAYHRYRESKGGRSTGLAPMTWTTQLLPYIAEQDAVLTCPNKSEDETSCASSALNEYFFSIYDGADHVRDLALTPGPRCRICSASNTTGYSAGVGPTKYSAYNSANPGPGHYVLEYEDLGSSDTDLGDADWEDMVLLIEPKPDGTFMCTDLYDGAGYTFQLVVKAPPNNTVIDSDFVPGNTFTAYGGGLASTYGMNSRVPSFVSDSSRIVMVEYCKSVAAVAPVPPATTVSDTWGTMVRPRHHGLTNVLFGDGSVKAMNPIAIDPRVTALQRELWKPVREY